MGISEKILRRSPDIGFSGVLRQRNGCDDEGRSFLVDGEQAENNREQQNAYQSLLCALVRGHAARPDQQGIQTIGGKRQDGIERDGGRDRALSEK